MPEELTGMTAAEAAAELLRMHYESMGVVGDVARDGNIVCVTTEGSGVHRGNVAEDYDSDVHLVCETDEVNSGPLAGGVNEEATIYWNEVVHGIADDYEGSALPTHAPTKSGSERKPPEGVDDHVRMLAARAGVDIYE